MKKRTPKKRKSDREVLNEIFPPEIVREVDRTVEEIDSERTVRENPTGRKLKPYSPKWLKKRRSE